MGGKIYASSTFQGVYYQVIFQSMDSFMLQLAEYRTFHCAFLTTFLLSSVSIFANLLIVYLYLTGILHYSSLINNKVSKFSYVY